MRKVIPAAVAVLAAFGLVAAGAVALLLTALLGTSSAATGPVTSIGTGTGWCLRAATFSGSVKIATCNPARRSQQWSVTRGQRYKLAGTRQYIVPSTTGLTLGSWAQAPGWQYENHLVMTGGLFLNWYSPGQPRLGTVPQTWYEFTTVP